MGTPNKDNPPLERRQPASHLKTLDWAGTIIFLTSAAQERRDYFNNWRAAATFHRLWSDGSRWQVGEYVIMPDHVHLFVRPRYPGQIGLCAWTGWWRGLAARELRSSVWQRGMWDVRMRSAEQYAEKREYVRQNPVRAALVHAPDDWPYRGKIHDLFWRDGL